MHTHTFTVKFMYLGWDPKFKAALFPDSLDFKRKGKFC